MHDPTLLSWCGQGTKKRQLRLPDQDLEEEVELLGARIKAAREEKHSTLADVLAAEREARAPCSETDVLRA